MYTPFKISRTYKFEGITEDEILNRSKVFFLIALLVSMAGSASSALLVNGDFQTGDLTGWTSFTTASGSTGAGLPDVVLFNTSGSAGSLAAHFSVGQTTVSTGQQGGGLFQNVVLAAGLYNFSANIASQDSPSGPNAEYGLFSVLVDGVQAGSVDLGPSSGPNSIARGTLSASFNIGSPGSHEIRIQITRTFLTGFAPVPQQYVDNADLAEAAAVPEPSAVSLLGAGFAILGLLRFLLFRVS